MITPTPGPPVPRPHPEPSPPTPPEPVPPRPPMARRWVMTPLGALAVAGEPGPGA